MKLIIPYEASTTFGKRLDSDRARGDGNDCILYDKHFYGS